MLVEGNFQPVVEAVERLQGRSDGWPVTSRSLSPAPRARRSTGASSATSAQTGELTGSRSGGRWGPPGAYAVLYVARPSASVTVEAYRHLVDPFADSGMTGDMVAPRRLLICDVHATEILDLRSAEAQTSVGITKSDLMSSVGEYDMPPRWSVAHQLGVARHHRSSTHEPRRDARPL